VFATICSDKEVCVNVRDGRSSIYVRDKRRFIQRCICVGSGSRDASSTGIVGVFATICSQRETGRVNPVVFKLETEVVQ